MDITKKIEESKENIIKSLQEIVQIPSVSSESVEDNPFGIEATRALNYYLKLGESFGFKTKNVDNYCGWIEYGEGEQMVGVITHLDVVPEGEGWDYPCFGGEIHNDRIYGRGTLDDKGAAIACLYALKFIKEEGINPNKRIRIIAGIDEEEQSRCVKRYIKTEELPTLGFTPDGNFPIIYAEKGISRYKLTRKQSLKFQQFEVMELSGGTAINIVPNKCSMKLKVDYDIEQLIEKIEQIISKNEFIMKITRENDIVDIISTGQSVHSAYCDKGINAITRMIVVLKILLDVSKQKCETIDFIYEKIGLSVRGEGLGCDFCDEISGKLTLNLAMIDYKNEQLSFNIDVRIPVLFSETDVFNNLQKHSQKIGISIEKLLVSPRVYIKEDSELIQKLLNVYRQQTNDFKSKPLAIGGGTYARYFENIVAFGPMFPGQIDTMHQKNESIEISKLLEIVEIYTNAILELAK